MSRRTFLVWLLVILATAATLRTLWLHADPPQISVTGVGVVWHDEGAWTHNARNRALWGVWRTDDWNPVYIAPVFTALEYVAFREFGVGLWQARLVPVVSGLVAIVFLAAGLACGRQPARGPHRQRAARDQLRIRDVEPRGPHGVDDDRVHRRRLGRVRAGRAPAGLGRRRGRRGGPGVVHESVGGVFRCGDCARRAEDDCPFAGAGVAGASRASPRPRQPRRARRSSRSRASWWPRSQSSRCSSGRTGRSTASTTGRCPCCANRSTTSGTSSIAPRGCRSCRRFSCACGWSWPGPPCRCWPSSRGGERRGRRSGCWSSGCSSGCSSSSCTTRATTGAT